VVGGQDCIELAAQRAHEHRVCRQRARGVECFCGRQQQALVLVAEQPAFTRMRIERAQGQPWRGDSPPPLQRVAGDATRLDDALRRHARDRVAQREMRGHEHDPQATRREHHRNGNVGGDMRQKLSDPGKPVAGGVQRRLIDRPGDDRVDLAGESQSRGGFDALGHHAPRLDVGRRPIFPPADDPYVSVDRLPQRLADHLRADPPRIAHRYCETRPRGWRGHG